MADFEKVWSIKIETRETQRALKELDKQVLKVEKSVEKAGKDWRKWIGKESTQATEKLNRSVKVTTLNVKKLQSGLQSASRKLAAMSAGFVALGGVSIRNVLKLNEGMANVSTLLNDGGKEVFKLKTEVQDLAKESGKSTEDLANGLYEVVSALGDTEEKMNQLKVASTAAIAGRSSTLESIKLLAAVTKGYGDTSEEAMKKVSDLSFLTVKLGQTTFPELAASMGRVIPTAAALNVQQEELFATFATMTGVTGNTAEVSTQVASVFRAMLKPTESLQKVVSKLGYSSASTMVKQLGLAKSLQILGDEVDNDQDKLAKMFNRAEGMTAVFSLLGKQQDVYNDKLKTFRSDAVAGQTLEAYKRQTEGINAQGHSWNQLQQRMIVFSQRLGDRLLPVLSKVMDRLEPLIKAIEKMDEETMDSWIALGKWVAIMAVATKGLSGMLGVVQALGNLSRMNAGINTMATGMGNLATQSSRALGFMSKLGLVGAAGAAGVALGTALNDIIFAPQSARRARKTETLAEAGFMAKQIARGTDTAAKQKELESLQAKMAQHRKEAGSASMEDLMGSLAYSVGAAEYSPGQLRQEAISSGKAGIKALKQSIEADKFEKWMTSGQGGYQVSESARNQESMSRMGGVGRGGTTVNTGPVNIRVDGSKDTRRTGQEIKKVMRELGRDIDRESTTVGASEI